MYRFREKNLTYFEGWDFRCLTKFDVVEDVSTTFMPHVLHSALRFFVDVSKFLKPKITTFGVDMLLESTLVSASGFVLMLGQTDSLRAGTHVQYICTCTCTCKLYLSMYMYMHTAAIVREPMP